MKVCVRELYPYPGYEDHVKMNIQTDEGGKVSMEELQAQIKAYKLGEGTTMRDFEIPGVEEGTTLKLRVITPANAPQTLACCAGHPRRRLCERQSGH